MEARERGDALVVRIDPDDCAALWRTVEPWLIAGKRQVVLDFAGVEFINSVNIAQVVALRQRAQAAGAAVRVVNLRENIKAVFRILRLDRIFALDDTLAPV